MTRKYTRKKPLPDYIPSARDRDILAMHNNGLNNQQIATCQGITRERVRVILKRFVKNGML